MNELICDYLNNSQYIEEYVFKQSLNIDKNVVELSVMAANIYFHITPAFTIYMGGLGIRSECTKLPADEFLIKHPLLMLYVYHNYHHNESNLRLVTDALQRMRTINEPMSRNLRCKMPSKK